MIMIIIMMIRMISLVALTLAMGAAREALLYFYLYLYLYYTYNYTYTILILIRAACEGLLHRARRQHVMLNTTQITLPYRDHIIPIAYYNGVAYARRSSVEPPRQERTVGIYMS